MYSKGATQIKCKMQSSTLKEISIMIMRPTILNIEIIGNRDRIKLQGKRKKAIGSSKREMKNLRNRFPGAE